MSSVLAANSDRDAASLRHYLLPISHLLQSDVTEVCINRPGEAWTESSSGWERHDIPALTFSHCFQLAKLIANWNTAAIRPETPILSGVLPSRERVQVVIPPACSDGTVSITIRKPSQVDKSLEELEAEGSFKHAAIAAEGLQPVDHELLKLRDEGRIREFLDLAVRAKKNILIGGATGSGKTTVMKSLAARIPHTDRVITIEDAHELFMTGFPNKVHLFFRSGGGKGDGPQCTSQDALRSCMRMKPDRILLAELRGAEAWDYMDSLNTGHPGSLSSIHCNSAMDAFNRLTSLIKQNPAGMNLSPEYIQQMCFETIDIVLYYQRRQLREIYFDPERRLAASRVRKGAEA